MSASRFSIEAMGTNVRYASQIAARSQARDVERALARGPVESLTRLEVEVDVEPITRTPIPQPARAWVRIAGEAFRVDCQVIAWTDHACEIVFTAGGKDLRAWVWSSAVRRRERRPQ